MTLHQTVTIPADRRLHLDLPLPENLPSGAAKLTCTIKPLKAGIFARKRRSRFDKALDAAIAQCKGKDFWGPDSAEYVRKIRDDRK